MLLKNKCYSNWPTSVIQINPQMLLNWPFIIIIPKNASQLSADATQNFLKLVSN